MEKNYRQDLTVQRAHPKRTERLKSERHHVSFTAIECSLADDRVGDGGRWFALGALVVQLVRGKPVNTKTMV